MLDPVEAESLPGELDPARRDEVAHTTARAVVHTARAAEDPEVVARLVRLVEEEGLDVVAELWSDAAPASLPGALWRLYALREWVRRDPRTIGLRYRLGVDVAPVHEVVAGVPRPPTPSDLRELADRVLSGVYGGDLAVALERAAAFCRILATGAAYDADARETADPDAAARMTRGASDLTRTAEELEHAAALWRAGSLD
ncbi:MULTISPECIES: hypothetical protein [Isoptericola]|uniref:DNA-directed RNA polymerase subunit beta n=1 Tax=Isoptericola sediminis TaxID=2733572 RepID=A0A849K763_9MICO|nr:MULTISPECIES: hypothetical protein [Isoptericola]MDO8143400.1 hypothetical protein [Isoptericola sp. 178]MDO8147263.1 hypothetical protein [Isoptericola sp. b515]MDO8150424.1 hypothetical protein [Isoptericola sp. b408]NNU27027.1 hypothetical protein [Isoptericola sediminis]